MNSFDVIVIGAGASGLMCASIAGQQGQSVLVVDSTNKPGKKILMSGGGRCNFTNYYVEPTNFLSANPHFCKSALSGYTQYDFIGLVADYGIAYEERDHGQLFCINSAKDILTMLLDECDKGGAQVRCKQTVTAIKKTDQGFDLSINDTAYQCTNLVIATGALSIPTMGATGFGYDVATQFGLKVLPRSAGLVPFTFSDGFKDISERLSGTAVPAVVSCSSFSYHENILFTHRGLSGPAVLQVSNYWQPGEPIYIELIPDQDKQTLLLNAKRSDPKIKLRTLLSRYLPKSLVGELQQMFWPDHVDTSLAEYSNDRLQQIAKHLSAWQLKPSGTEGYRTAEVTLGGVDTDELSSKTMQCKSVQGLYFIGEVVDVTGHLGGFNFQWAWSSAHAAAQHICATNRG